MTFDEVRKRLQDRNLTKVSAGSGVSRPTLIKIRDKDSENVFYSVIRKLSDYFEQQEKGE